MSILHKFLLFQILVVYTFSLYAKNYIDIEEFEKVKIGIKNDIYRFKYIPKENEEIIYSDLLINLENNLIVGFEIKINICLYNYDPENEKGDYQCITVNDSKTLIFTAPVIKDKQTNYYIKIKCEENYPLDDNEYMEFYLFFISHKINFDFNTNGYIFKFNEKLISNNYSQEYLEFQNPSYDKDKILKIKIKFKDDIEEEYTNLFEIKNLETNESIIYNIPNIYEKIEKNTKNLIKINHLSDIKILYIFYDDEIIDLTNVKKDYFFIYENQTFFLNLSESQKGFLIHPSESVLNGQINFYIKKNEIYKSRELETDKTCFYIEKRNDASLYYINFNVSDYIVYKFIIMENFEIINDIKNRILPHNATKYFIFPYNEKKIQNNDYYYGIKIGFDNLYSKQKIRISLIKESKNYKNFPIYDSEFLLLKNHFIIKLISSRKDDLEIATYYSPTIKNNIKIYTNNNPELMNIFSNKEIYIHPKIDEYLLIYDTHFDFIGFNINGEGSLYYYNKEVNFEMIENGLDYEQTNNFVGEAEYTYLFIHLTIEENKYYQLNMFPELVDLNLNLDSYYLISGKLSIDTDVAITIKNENTHFADEGLKINHNGETTEILENTGGNLTEIFKKEDEKLDIYSMRSSGLEPKPFYITKKYENESIQIVGSNKYLKLVLPYIKQDSIFLTGYGYKKDDEFFTNHLIEYNPSEYYDKEVRFYFDDKKYFGIYKIKLYGFNKIDYPEKIKYDEFELYNEEKFKSSNGYYINIKESLFINIFYKHFMINKCKNDKINLHFGGNFKFYFDKEINESSYFDFSKYTQDDILEIEANEDYLLFPGKDNRKNKNIKSTDEIYKNTYFNFTYEDNNFSLLKNQKTLYIFAPKTSYYIENFKNECFLLKICQGLIIDSSIFKTENNDFKGVLKKEYKEYIATIVISGINSDNNCTNYYFYNTIDIKVTQEVLDKLDGDSGFLTPVTIIIIVLAIVIVIIITVIIIIICIKKRKDKSITTKNIIDEIDEKSNLVD